MQSKGAGKVTLWSLPPQAQQHGYLIRGSHIPTSTLQHTFSTRFDFLAMPKGILNNFQPSRLKYKARAK